MLPMNEESRLDFEQKHEEDLQRLRGFRLLDDDFMILPVQMRKICIMKFWLTVCIILKKMRKGWR